MTCNAWRPDEPACSDCGGALDCRANCRDCGRSASETAPGRLSGFSLDPVHVHLYASRAASWRPAGHGRQA